MAILSNLLKKGIRLRESLEQEYSSPIDLQKERLKKLLLKTERAEIGKKYNFQKILKSFRNGNQEFYELFKIQVPIYDYNSIHAEFWKKLQDGKKNVTWPGAVKYFALSSGTSGAASKYIPITKSMVKAIRRTGVRQILTLSKYDLPASLFTKGILMLGGSTDLEFNGTYFSGDLSGITASKLPIWLQRFYKPGKKIARNRNWGNKLDHHLKSLNDDYAVERKHALKKVIVDVLPSGVFYEWMKSQGKEGGQNKFPRVLKGEKAENWQKFLSDKGYCK